jgi:GDP-D-mannose 3', 5'-epimerase
MCRHFEEDFGLPCRVARFHNVYGPNGTYDGGREKAPAAICRKVIEAISTGKRAIEIWGDGQQTRSFMYIDDCVRGIQMIMESDIHEPLNLGSAELVTIDELVDMVEEIAGIKLQRNYKLDAAKGVNGRNSDNTKIRHDLGWEPATKMRYGLAKTYAWIGSRCGCIQPGPIQVSPPNRSSIPHSERRPHVQKPSESKKGAAPATYQRDDERTI